MKSLRPYGEGVFCLDADYVRSDLAAIHFIVEHGRVAFVDTGCNSSHPQVMRALGELGLGAECVDYVILTHVHLDHAGGAGMMMRAFPNARLVVHPRGARHMVDPSKLIQGSAAVYGVDEVFRLYGDVLPVEHARIIEASDGTHLDLAGRRLTCLDTPGHAKHHIAILDGGTGNLFTGDVFGISYRALDNGDKEFIFLTTTPVQFDPEAMHLSIDRILSYKPDYVFLTHFGRVGNIQQKGAVLHRLVDAFVMIAEQEREAGVDRHERIRGSLERLLVDEATRFGTGISQAEILELFANDLELNAQGLGIWLDSVQR